MSAMPGKFFQSHQISALGTPGIPPTAVTQRPCYLYDYTIVSAMFQSIYNDRVYYGQRQYLTVSGRVEYFLRNQSNEPVNCEAYIWQVKKPVPFQMAYMAIPGSVTSPVYTGNLLNVLGAAASEDLQNYNNPNGLNAALDAGDLELSMLPTFGEYIDYKRYRFRLKPGHIKKFHVMSRRVELASNDLYSPLNSTTVKPWTDQTYWAQAFVPGAKGILFRILGSLGRPAANAYGDNAYSQYTAPAVNLLSKHTYYAYRNYSQATNPIFAADFGTQVPVGTTKIMVDGGSVAADLTNA